MSDTLLGVIIGGTFGFLGAITGIIANTYLDHKRARRERLREVRLRLVGDQIQTSEVLDYLRTARRRQWPRFWLIEHADLSRANLREVDLRGVNMSFVKLFRANLAGSDLDYTNLSHCDLSKAEMIRADLSNANLLGARLGRVNLSYADLFKANLANAFLSNADLSHADLSQANLSNADLTRADLSGAKLIGAKVTDEQLARARSLAGAVLPDGSTYLATQAAQAAQVPAQIPDAQPAEQGV